MFIKRIGRTRWLIIIGDKTLIAKARRWRKVLGGGMRQAGIIAAAGKLALTENIDRLADDHHNARYLAEQLNNVNGFSVNLDHIQTNMAFLKVDQHIDQTQLIDTLKQQGILISGGNPMRFVTHLDITTNDIDTFITALKKCAITAHLFFIKRTLSHNHYPVNMGFNFNI